MKQPKCKNQAFLCLIELFISDPGFCDYFFSFQPGRAYKNYFDGDSAAACGHMYLIQNREMMYTSAACSRAAKNGHLDVLKYLWNYPPTRSTGLLSCRRDEYVYKAACDGHYWKIIDWLICKDYAKTNRIDPFAYWIFQWGHEATIRQFYALHRDKFRRYNDPDFVLSFAAKNPDVDAAKFAEKIAGRKFDIWYAKMAIKHDNLPLVKYFVSRGIIPRYYIPDFDVSSQMKDYFGLVYFYSAGLAHSDYNPENMREWLALNFTSREVRNICQKVTNKYVAINNNIYTYECRN